MAALVWQLILRGVSALGSLLAAAVFRAAAVVAVAVVYLVKAQREACDDALELARDLISSGFRNAVGLLGDAAAAALSALLDWLVDVAVGSVRLGASAAAAALDLARSALDTAAEVALQAVAGVWEVAGEVAAALWRNSASAVSYISEKI